MSCRVVSHCKCFVCQRTQFWLVLSSDRGFWFSGAQAQELSSPLHSIKLQKWPRSQEIQKEHILSPCKDRHIFLSYWDNQTFPTSAQPKNDTVLFISAIFQLVKTVLLKIMCHIVMQFETGSGFIPTYLNKYIIPELQNRYLSNEKL